MTYFQPLRSLILVVVMVLLIACVPPAPQAPTLTKEVAVVTPISTETPIPTLRRVSTSTLTPTKKPFSTPSPTAIPSLTPTLRPFEEFVFGDQENVAFTYNTLLWQHHFTKTLGTIDNFLQSKEFVTCIIQDVGATEIGPYGTKPNAVKIVDAGKFRYKAWIFSFNDSTPELVQGWYLEQGGLKGYSYTDSAGPVVTIQSNIDEWQRCEQEARQILSTVHIVTK